ncbi:MAG: YbgC/FadM family acyl-CoA thioesterase [Betaproteobacteria bacterium]
MNAGDFRFLHRLRVRWCEVDAQKIVFNAHYLMYLDTAMADYWRAMALPYEATLAQFGGDLYVKKSTLEYHGSARYDDALEIGLKCYRLGNSSLTFTAAILCGSDALVTGELIHVFADPATQTSRPLPAPLREVFLAFEDGQEMVHVRCGTWGELGPDAADLRTQVFVREQKISKEMERDEADTTAVHAVAYNRLGQPVATGRLLQHERGVGRIGRLAASRLLRGAGFGSAILRHLMAAARARGDHSVVLHAQRSAQGFYQRAGFAPRGEPFDEAGISHIEMHAATGLCA